MSMPPRDDAEIPPLGEAIATWFRSLELPGLISVRLHGSHARGQAHAHSDVDVAILVEREAYPTRLDRSELRVTLTADLIGAIHHNEVDLQIMNDLPPRFARDILHHGILLHRNDLDADAQFAALVQGMAADLDVTLEKFAPLLREALRR